MLGGVAGAIHRGTVTHLAGSNELAAMPLICAVYTFGVVGAIHRGTVSHPAGSNELAAMPLSCAVYTKRSGRCHSQRY